MKCTNCGKEIEDGALFCPFCKEEVIKVEIIEQEPIVGTAEEVKEPEKTENVENAEEPKEAIEGEVTTEPGNSEEETIVEEPDKITIYSNESKMHLITLAMIILLFGSPTITVSLYMSLNRKAYTSIPVIVGAVYVVLLVISSSITSKYSRKSDKIHRDFVIQVVLTVLSCVAYMFFIYLCDGCFNMSCPG